MKRRSILIEKPWRPAEWERSRWSEEDLQASESLCRLVVSISSGLSDSSRLLLSSMQVVWDDPFVPFCVSWSVGNLRFGFPNPFRTIPVGIDCYAVFWQGYMLSQGAPRLDKAPDATVLMLPPGSDALERLAIACDNAEDSFLLSLRYLVQKPSEMARLIQGGGALFHCDPTSYDNTVGTLYAASEDVDKLYQVTDILVGTVESRIDG